MEFSKFMQMDCPRWLLTPTIKGKEALEKQSELQKQKSVYKMLKIDKRPYFR